MLKFDKVLSIDIPYQFSEDKSIELSDLLFFDIETTGFLADVSSIYLIGCCYYEAGSWHMVQWFADDYVSEKDILCSFLALANNYKFLVHYNGTTFDVPYLTKKLIQHSIPNTILDMQQIDLYKRISPYKTILNLQNTKQKTVESRFQISRKDTYSGGELIEVYVSYMKDKFMRQANLNEHLKKLLLHNEEDVVNLVQLMSILSYQDLFDETHPIIHVNRLESKLKIELELNNPIPVPFDYSEFKIDVSACNNWLTVTVPIFSGELKYFYPNYKDYYYLPSEDTAIHKSVAEFVDKSLREKAKASTCYTKRTGEFIPQFLGKLTPSFQLDYKDKTSFIELTEGFLNDSEKLSTYVSSILQYSRNKHRQGSRTT